LKRLARQLVALAFFFSNRKQPHPRMLHAENRAAINIPHHRELLEIGGRAIDVRADVEQNAAVFRP
jgi:hypothetical protein